MSGYLLFGLGFFWSYLLHSSSLKKRIENKEYKYSFLRFIFLLNNKILFPFAKIPLFIPLIRAFIPFLFVLLLNILFRSFLPIGFTLLGSLSAEIYSFYFRKKLGIL